MIRIVLTEEQMHAIADTDEPIDLIAPSGRMIGRVSPESKAPLNPEPSPTQLAEIKRRMADAKANPDSFRTWGEIKSRLQSQKHP